MPLLPSFWVMSSMPQRPRVFQVVHLKSFRSFTLSGQEGSCYDRLCLDHAQMIKFGGIWSNFSTEP